MNGTATMVRAVFFVRRFVAVAPRLQLRHRRCGAVAPGSPVFIDGICHPSC